MPAARVRPLDKYRNQQYIAICYDTGTETGAPQGSGRLSPRSGTGADAVRGLQGGAGRAGWADQPAVSLAARERRAAAHDQRDAPAPGALLQGPSRVSGG